MSEQAPNRFAQMEADAASAISANQATVAATNEAAASAAAAAEATETRRNSAEVQNLNDLAELQIFGSRGRTYTDPTTGELLANTEHPLTGKLDNILTNRRFGTTEAERQVTASSYVENLTNLTDNGLELTQAKLVLDLREERSESEARLSKKLVGEYIQTDNKSVAVQKAVEKVANRAVLSGDSDEFAQHVIRTKGIYSREEFDQFKMSDEYKSMLRQSIDDARNSKNQNSRDNAAANYADRTRRQAAAVNPNPNANPSVGPNGNPVTPATTEAERLSILAEAAETYETLAGQVELARNEYLRMRAANARRSIAVKGEYRNPQIAEARADYEALRDDMISLVLTAEGVNGRSEEEVLALLDAESINLELHLAQAYRDERLVATGNYSFNQDGDVVQVQKGRLGSAANKFYEWFGNVNAGGKRFSKGALKKGLAMGAIGAIVAVPTGLILGSILPFAGATGAVVAGGVIANRVAKAYMATHINKRSTEVNDRFANRQTQELLNSYNTDTEMADLIDSQAKREVSRNRKRAGLMMGAAAIGGLISAELASELGLGSGSPAASAKGNTPLKPGSPVGHPTGTPPKSGGGVAPAPAAPNANPNTVDGFDTNVTVEAGHGYIKELNDLFEQKSITLRGNQSAALYDHLVDKFPKLKGSFFTNDPSYLRSQGDYGISKPGNAHWNPAVIAEIDAWAKLNNVK